MNHSREVHASSTTSGGVGLSGLLGLLFVGLKLTGYIDWSWWWVLLPFYGPAALLLAFAALMFAVAGIATLLSR